MLYSAASWTYKYSNYKYISSPKKNGFLSNRNRKEKISLCKKLLAVVMNKKYIESLTQYQKLNAYEFMLKVKGIDITVCPCCGSGKMITKSEMLPKNCSPPVYYYN